MAVAKSKIIIGLALVSGVAIASVGLILAMNLNPDDTSIHFTLLDNAGVMIEAQDIRIYIDPYNLPDNQTAPADIILVTHPHGDHYHYASINQIATEETVFIFSSNMTTEIARHDGISLNPGDSYQVGTINITAFYMYTFPPEGYEETEASHPQECNYTSYLIDINGFTIFHAGDSKCIDEYDQLTGKVDVALLPLGPGCQTMYRSEVVDALEIIEPKYFIPIHFTVEEKDEFVDIYDTHIENHGIQILNLGYFTSYEFDESDT
ncbi:MAG: MBL fold metallo-hydrolase [Candidatus Thorarchaeota archaeon]